MSDDKFIIDQEKLSDPQQQKINKILKELSERPIQHFRDLNKSEDYAKWYISIERELVNGLAQMAALVSDDPDLPESEKESLCDLLSALHVLYAEHGGIHKWELDALEDQLRGMMPATEVVQ